jgi:hypothetical protein
VSVRVDEVHDLVLRAFEYGYLTALDDTGQLFRGRKRAGTIRDAAARYAEQVVAARYGVVPARFAPPPLPPPRPPFWRRKAFWRGLLLYKLRHGP